MLDGSLYNSTNTLQRLCIHALLVEQAERTPDAPAILASGRAPLTYGLLWRHVDEVVQALRAMGLSRQDRVALILPNGAEMAVALTQDEGYERSWQRRGSRLAWNHAMTVTWSS